MKWWNDLCCYLGYHDFEHYSNCIEFDPGIQYNVSDLVMVCVSNGLSSDVGKCVSWRKCRCCSEVQICSGSKGLGGFGKEYTMVTLLDQSGGIYADLLWNGRRGLSGCYQLMTVKEMKKRYRNFTGIVYNEHVSIVPIPSELKRVSAVHGVRSIDDE